MAQVETDRKEHQIIKLLNYEQLGLSLEIKYLTIADTLTLSNELNETVTQDVFTKDTLIMFFYSKLNCSSCLRSLFGSLNWHVKDNFFLISDYSTKRDLYDFKRSSGISEVMVYRNLNKCFSEVYEIHPFFIVKTKKSVEVFIPDNDFEQRTLWFLKHWNLI